MAERLAFHPMAEVLPLLEGQDFDELVRDIKDNGLLDPIVIHDGKVLDGRNRYLACLEANVEPTFKTWSGKGKLLSFVLSVNLQRRHLTTSQRAMIADKLTTLSQGRSKSNASNEAFEDNQISQTDAAEALHVGRSTVQRAATVHEHGTPELVAAVDTRKITVSKAAKIATKPEAEQKAVVKQVIAGTKSKDSRVPNPDKPKGKLAKLETLIGQVVREIDVVAHHIGGPSPRTREMHKTMQAFKHQAVELKKAFRKELA